MYIFNSRKDKTPFGAVKTGEMVYITFKATDCDPDSVTLILRQEGGSVRNIVLKKDVEDGVVFTTAFSVPKFGLYFYKFSVRYGEQTVTVGRNADADATEFSDWEWQLTVYDRSFQPPKKSGSDIVYHIFVDRFNRVGELSEVDYGTIHKNWYEDVSVAGADGVYHADDFFGGNLQGIIEKLDYLKDLGVTVIFLSPIFCSHSNHRYDTADYMRIDPMIGTEEDFAELIGKARIRGMRVMLDGVFNHSGSDSVYFNRNGYFDSFGAYQGSASPYRDWYTFNKDGTYHSWWGIDCVPTFNKKSRTLRKYLFGEDGVLAKWSKFDIDWRLDVADELPPDYLEELRNRVKIENPSSTVIGEVWEDASKKYSYDILRPYFTKGELDGVMNYVFRNLILDFAKGRYAKNVARGINDLVENYPSGCMAASLTMLGSHDTIRVIFDLADISVEGWSQQRQKDLRLSPEQKRLATDRLFVAAALEYILPGMPSIYYGDEIGLEGGKDPVNRRTYPWGRGNTTILNYYKKLGVMRGNLANALKGGTRAEEYDEMLIVKRGEGLNSCIFIGNTSGKPHSYPIDKRYVDMITGEEYVDSVFVPHNSAVVIKEK